MSPGSSISSPVDEKSNPVELNSSEEDESKIGPVDDDEEEPEAELEDELEDELLGDDEEDAELIDEDGDELEEDELEED